MDLKRKGCAALMAALLLLGACSGKDDGAVRDDVPVADLVTAIDAQIEGSDGLIEPGDGYIVGSMKLDPEALGEYVVKISAFSTSINEYGVFKAASPEEAETLEGTLKDYLTMRNETWMTEYLPEEYPKLENAKVVREGCYVLYTILSDTERDAVGTAFSGALEG